jgi:hypothetical protein
MNAPLHIKEMLTSALTLTSIGGLVLGGYLAFDFVWSEYRFEGVFLPTVVLTISLVSAVTARSLMKYDKNQSTVL